jgi:hypothetical protein
MVNGVDSETIKKSESKTSKLEKWFNTSEINLDLDWNGKVKSLIELNGPK